jgi:hypothetical protein
MSDDLAKKFEIEPPPAPYGRHPDGAPLTAIEASAKQMDDWAGRFGFSGSVRMGIGTQHEEPKKWHGVDIVEGRIKSIPPSSTTSYIGPHYDRLVPLKAQPSFATTVEAVPQSSVTSYVAPPSLFRRVLNFFKGKSNVQAS